MEELLSRLSQGLGANLKDFGLEVNDLVTHFSSSSNLPRLHLEVDPKGSVSVSSLREARLAKVVEIVKKSLENFLESRTQDARGVLVSRKDFSPQIGVPGHFPDLLWLEPEPAARLQSGSLIPIDIFNHSSFLVKAMDSEDKTLRKKIYKTFLQCFNTGHARLAFLIDPFLRRMTLFKKVGQRIDIDMNQERWRDLSGDPLFPGFILSARAMDAIEIPLSSVTVLENNERILQSEMNAEKYDEENTLIETIKPNRARERTEPKEESKRKRTRRRVSRLVPLSPMLSQESETSDMQSLRTCVSGGKENDFMDSDSEFPVYADSVRVILVYPDEDDLDHFWPGMFVPPQDRESTIETESRILSRLGQHVPPCAPDVPLVRYFEDGTYQALDNPNDKYKFYDPTIELFQTFLTDHEHSKDRAVQRALQFIKTRELPERLKWQAWKDADKKRMDYLRNHDEVMGGTTSDRKKRR